MGLFTLCDLKKNAHAESVSVIAYGYKRIASSAYDRWDHMKKAHI